MKLSLRPYQIACHDAVLKTWGIAPWWDGEADTFRSTLANLATSAGKTLIAGQLCITLSEMGKRIAFLGDTDELCQQPLDKFRRLGLYAALEKASERAPASAKVIVASAQTLAIPARLDAFSQRWKPDFIICDEAHRRSHNTKKITDSWPEAKVLGLTATAFRSGLKDLSEFYEHVCFELGTFDLIGQGYISPIRVQPLPIKIDLTNVGTAKKFGESDYKEADLEEAITPYYEAVARGLLEFAPNRQTVAFLPLRNSSRRFVEVLRAHGISAEHVDGDSPDRKELQARFEAREFRVLSNSMLLTTGWDCPPCDCLLNLRPTKSVGLFRQMVGRIIRVLDGVIDGIPTAEERHALIAASLKPDALILDPLWQTASMGLVGPASLIANTEDEAEALTKREKKQDTPWDVAEEFRKMKEEQLVDKLRQQAEKQRQQLEAMRRGDTMPIDAMQLATMFHQVELLDYQPVSRWEKGPLTDWQKDRLAKDGLDLSTVKDRGHAQRLIEALNVRRAAGLVLPKTVMILKARDIPEAEQFTVEAAAAVIGERFWTFGKFKGRPLSAAPKSYLRWLSEQNWLARWTEEHAYVQEQLGLATPRLEPAVAHKEDSIPF